MYVQPKIALFPNINEIVVDNTETSKGEKFSIHDNQKRNRNLVFSSPTGLEMLSKSDKIKSDETFHTRAKYFGQMYVIHATFRAKKYDETKNLYQFYPKKKYVELLIPKTIKMMIQVMRLMILMMSLFLMNQSMK